MSDRNISLAPFASKNLELLRDWLSQDHVKQWYPEPESNIEWARNPPAGGDHGLLEVNGAAVGYIRWQLVDRETLDSIGLNQIPDNSADVDILIGNHAQISKGIGPAALNLIASTLKAQGNVPLIGLTSSKDNAFAHKAFIKAGYSKIGEYSPDGYGDCYLFTLALQ